MNDFFVLVLGSLSLLVKLLTNINLVGIIWIILFFLYIIISFLIIKRKYKYKKFFILINFLPILLLTFEWYLIEVIQLSLFIDAILLILFIKQKIIKTSSIIFCFIILIHSGLTHINYHKNTPYSETVLNKLVWFVDDSLNAYLYHLRNIFEYDIIGVKTISEYYLLNIHTKKLKTIHNYLFLNQKNDIEMEKENLIIILNWILINNNYSKLGILPSKEHILNVLQEKPEKFYKISEQDYENFLYNIKNSDFTKLE